MEESNTENRVVTGLTL